MMIARMSKELPRSLRGYAIWLQVNHGGDWFEVCTLSPAAARQVCRWLDWHLTNRVIRVLYTRV